MLRFPFGVVIVFQLLLCARFNTSSSLILKFLNHLNRI
jgi:hypothetical protein